MKKGEQSKQHLIECAAQLFWQHGYNATSISEILKEAEMTKGSFYFYFKNKKDLAVAVIAYYQHQITEWLQASSDNKQWEDFVKDFISSMMTAAANNAHYGCPFAVVGIELAFSEPDISPDYTAALEGVEDLFQRVLEYSGIPKSHAPVLANRLFSIYEGELLLYRISKDIAYLKKMQFNLIHTYQEYRSHYAL